MAPNTPASQVASFSAYHASKALVAAVKRVSSYAPNRITRYVCRALKKALDDAKKDALKVKSMSVKHQSDYPNIITKWNDTSDEMMNDDGVAAVDHASEAGTVATPVKSKGSKKLSAAKAKAKTPAKPVKKATTSSRTGQSAMSPDSAAFEVAHVLDYIPHTPLHLIPSSSSSSPKKKGARSRAIDSSSSPTKFDSEEQHTWNKHHPLLVAYSEYLKRIAFIDFLVVTLGICVKTNLPRIPAPSASLSDSDVVWLKNLMDESSGVLTILGEFHSSCMLESFRSDHIDKSKGHLNFDEPSIYLIRVVCANGAVVREGPEIDCFGTVDNLAMNTVVVATERKVDSGVMRYHVPSGWISDSLRAANREPIIEVLDIRTSPSTTSRAAETLDASRGVEVFTQVATLTGAGSRMMRRLHSSFRLLMRHLIRCLSPASRATRSIVDQPISRKPRHPQFARLTEVSSNIILKTMKSSVEAYESRKRLVSSSSSLKLSEVCGCCGAYFLSVTELLGSSMFDEKRDGTEMLNSILFYEFYVSGGFEVIFDILLSSFHLAVSGVKEDMTLVSERFPKQSMTRSFVSALLAVLNLLSRFATRSMLLSRLLSDESFSASMTVLQLHMAMAENLKSILQNDECDILPSDVIQALLAYIKTLMQSLSEAENIDPETGESKDSPSAILSSSSSSSSSLPSSLAARVGLSGMRQMLGGGSSILRTIAEASGTERGESIANALPPPPQFEPDQGVIETLSGMGFNAAHVRQSMNRLRTNRPELLADFMLSHPFVSSSSSTSSTSTTNTANAVGRGGMTATTTASINNNSQSRPSVAAVSTSASSIATDQQGATNSESDRQSVQSRPTLVSSTTQPIQPDLKRSAMEQKSNTVLIEKAAVLLKEFREISVEVSLRLLVGRRPAVARPSVPRSLQSHQENSSEMLESQVSFSIADFLNEACKAESFIAMDDLIVLLLKLFHLFTKQTIEESQVLVGPDDSNVSTPTKSTRSSPRQHQQPSKKKKTSRKRSPSPKEGKTSIENDDDEVGKGDFVKFMYLQIRVLLRKSGSKDFVREDSDRQLFGIVHLLSVLLQRSGVNILLRLRHATEFLHDASNDNSDFLYKEISRDLIALLSHLIRRANETKKWAIWGSPCLLLLDIFSQPLIPANESLDSKPGYPDTEAAKAGSSSSSSSSSSFTTTRLAEVQDAEAKSPTMLSDVAPMLECLLNQEESFESLELVLSLLSLARCNRENSNIKPIFQYLHHHTLLSKVTKLPIKADTLTPLSVSSSPTLQVESNVMVLPPLLAHAALSLLLRLVRNPEGSKLFTTMNGGHKLLSLTAHSSFIGKTYLVAGILRSVFEQPLVLRYAMEQELRSIMENLSRKYFRKLHQRYVSDHPEGNPSAQVLRQLKERSSRVPFVTFVDVVIPLVSRNPSVFLKAANALLVLHGDSKDDKPKYVSLRASPLETVVSPTGVIALSSSSSNDPSAMNSSPSKKRSRSMSGSKNKDEVGDGMNIPETLTKTSVNPLNHVVNSLITALLSSPILVPAPRPSVGEEGDIGLNSLSFMSSCDILNILTEYINALPSVAISVHRFHHRNKKALKNLQHAVHGCVRPANPTFITFVLHHLLPLEPTPSVDEEAILKSTDSAMGTEEEPAARLKRIRMETTSIIDARIKTSESASRLLVALCDRGGEGRRRVITELIQALRLTPDGYTETSTNVKELVLPKVASVPSEHIPSYAQSAYGDMSYGLAAIKAWGELLETIAKSTPSGNKSDARINQSNNDLTSWEVLRLLEDLNANKVLFHALRRLPMSSSTPKSKTDSVVSVTSVASCLLRPLDILTRPATSEYLKAHPVSHTAKNASTVEASSQGATNSIATPANSSNRSENARHRGRTSSRSRRSNPSSSSSAAVSTPSQATDDTVPQSRSEANSGDSVNEERYRSNRSRNNSEADPAPSSHHRGYSLESDGYGDGFDAEAIEANTVGVLPPSPAPAMANESISDVASELARDIGEHVEVNQDLILTTDGTNVSLAVDEDGFVEEIVSDEEDDDDEDGERIDGDASSDEEDESEGDEEVDSEEEDDDEDGSDSEEEEEDEEDEDDDEHDMDDEEDEEEFEGGVPFHSFHGNEEDEDEEDEFMVGDGFNAFEEEEEENDDDGNNDDDVEESLFDMSGVGMEDEMGLPDDRPRLMRTTMPGGSRGGGMNANNAITNIMNILHGASGGRGIDVSSGFNNNRSLNDLLRNAERQGGSFNVQVVTNSAPHQRDHGSLLQNMLMGVDRNMEIIDVVNHGGARGRGVVVRRMQSGTSHGLGGRSNGPVFAGESNGPFGSRPQGAHPLLGSSSRQIGVPGGVVRNTVRIGDSSSVLDSRLQDPFNRLTSPEDIQQSLTSFFADTGITGHSSDSRNDSLQSLLENGVISTSGHVPRWLDNAPSGNRSAHQRFTQQVMNHWWERERASLPPESSNDSVVPDSPRPPVNLNFLAAAPSPSDSGDEQTSQQMNGSDVRGSNSLFSGTPISPIQQVRSPSVSTSAGPDGAADTIVPTAPDSLLSIGGIVDWARRNFSPRREQVDTATTTQTSNSDPTGQTSNNSETRNGDVANEAEASESKEEQQELREDKELAPPDIAEDKMQDDQEGTAAGSPVAEEKASSSNHGEESMDAEDSCAMNQTSSSDRCPEGVDPEVWASLPDELRREYLVEDEAGEDLSEDDIALASRSGLDIAMLRELPAEMRRDILSQHSNQEQSSSIVDGSMDASNVSGALNHSTGDDNQPESGSATSAPIARASSAPLLTLEFLNSLPDDARRDVLAQTPASDLENLPPDMRAEAQFLSTMMANMSRPAAPTAAGRDTNPSNSASSASAAAAAAGSSSSSSSSSSSTAINRPEADELWKTTRRVGQMRLEGERTVSLNIDGGDLAGTLRMLYLIPPGVPPRLVHRPLLNLCSSESHRVSIVSSLVALLLGDYSTTRQLLDFQSIEDSCEFPPRHLLGGVLTNQQQLGSAVAASATNFNEVPTVVVGRILDVLNYLVKYSSRVVFDLLSHDGDPSKVATLPKNLSEEDAMSPPLKRSKLGKKEGRSAAPSNTSKLFHGVMESHLCRLIGLLERREFKLSNIHLDQLLQLLENVTLPLNFIREDGLPPHAVLKSSMSGSEAETRNLNTEISSAQTPSHSRGAGEQSQHMADDPPSRSQSVTRSRSVQRDTSAESQSTDTAAPIEGPDRGMPGSAPLGPEPSIDMNTTGTSTSISGQQSRHPTHLRDSFRRTFEAAMSASAGSASNQASYDFEGGYINPSGSSRSGRHRTISNFPFPPPSRSTSHRHAAHHLAGTPPIWASIPGLAGIERSKLQTLCQLISLDTCSEITFNRLMKILQHLSKPHLNRDVIKRSLSDLVHFLGRDAMNELCVLRADLELYARKRRVEVANFVDQENAEELVKSRLPPLSSVLSGSGMSEVKLLRGLKAICSIYQPSDNKASGATSRSIGASESVYNSSSHNVNTPLPTLNATLATPSNAKLPKAPLRLVDLNLSSLWDALSSCLSIVSELEGINPKDDDTKDKVDEDAMEDEPPVSAPLTSTRRSRPRAMSEASDGGGDHGASTANEVEAPQLKNSSAIASLLARFLPLIEAFVVMCEDSGATTPMPLDPEDISTLLTPSTPKAPLSTDNSSVGASALRKHVAQHMRNVSLPGARFRLPAASSSTATASNSALPPNDNVTVRMEEESPAAKTLVKFVRQHKVLLNALVRQNPSLLHSPNGSLCALVKVYRARSCFDFDNKRSYFRQCLRKQRQAATRSAGPLRITIRRDMVLEDSYQQIRFKNREELKGKLNVTFSDEEGVDAGGVTREWYSVLAKEIFNPGFGLFTPTSDGATYQPYAMSGVNEDHLSYFKFVGRVIGKAVADGHLLDAHFTRSFYKHILGVPVTVDDMEGVDPEYFKNLKQILSHNLDDIGLELTFSSESHEFGVEKTVDLIPNGRNVTVTDETKYEYVSLVCRHRMTSGIHKQIESFLEGFYDLVPPELISIFNEKELELLISGLPNIDLDDLMMNTEYVGYKSSDPQIEWFWSVLRSLRREELASFLQFVTGSAKVPIEGFAELQGMRGPQKFNIHKSLTGKNMLPSSHTCFNQLDLPEYENEEQLKAKVILAISEGATGFGFG